MPTVTRFAPSPTGPLHLGGARTALFVGIVSSVVGACIGLVLGVGSAYFGGTTDLLFQRFMDVFMSFPLVIMALAIVAIFGTGVDKVIIAITIPGIPPPEPKSMVVF